VSRIAETFERVRAERRKALIPFVTAGDPQRACNVPIMRALAAAGADVIELGVPFSDPMADGPAIQRASERALASGISLADILQDVKSFRSTDRRTPVVLMGYANPVEAMGIECFAERAADSGVDGVLTVDYPPEEARPLVQALAARSVDSIFLVAPTSTDARMREIARVARGYLYYVSLKGVTGATHLDLADVRAKLERLRRYTELPIGVGFGIRDGATARAMAELADAVVIGSALVERIERADADSAPRVAGEFVREIRSAMDSA
jgi:tryptophan synthase alpha chain